ncbi:HtaA domain-containing protein [Mycetocola sp.]|uniref:HtaA domain-containing protein n=1 Tax=Mycetocola sp. TaxID=1871042 RepID=UPI0039895D5F
MATKPELFWAVKDSLIAYIEALDDGTVETLEPASREGGGFRFPGRQESGDRDDDSLQFLGTVRLTGYWGALDIELRDPRIELAGERGTLLVRERGGLDADRFLPFADLVLQNRMTDLDSGASSLEATASLTGQGQILMGGQYRVGQALNPLRVTFAPGDE